MWILVTVLVVVGALASYYYDSLVPGILCCNMALCALGWQFLSGGKQ